MSIQVARFCSLLVDVLPVQLTHLSRPRTQTAVQVICSCPTSFELFITDPRNVFGAGSSFEYRNVGFSVIFSVFCFCCWFCARHPCRTSCLRSHFLSVRHLEQHNALCPIRPDLQNVRVCFLTFDVQVPSSMSVQFIANTAYQGAAVDQSSFVLLPSPLPATPQLLARLYNAPLQYNCLDNRTSFAIFSSSQVVLQDDLDA